MIGMDLRSDTKYYNNIYKGTKNYSSAHFEFPQLQVYGKQSGYEYLKTTLTYRFIKSISQMMIKILIKNYWEMRRT